MNDIAHWLPYVLPSIAFAVGWGLTQAKLSRVIDDLKEQRIENKELRAELHSVREDLHELRETVVRLDERYHTGKHPTIKG